LVPEVRCSQIVLLTTRRTSRLCLAGLVLREEIDINVCGSMGKSHMAMRSDHTNVRPPAEVH